VRAARAWITTRKRAFARARMRASVRLRAKDCCDA
jgi:hypothetical protein